MQQEYENLLTALQLALTVQTSVVGLHGVLTEYLEQMQEPQRGLELTESVWSGLQSYPVEMQTGEEIIAILHRLASWYLLLKQHNLAEQVYRLALERMEQITFLEKHVVKQYSASIYHQLGRVAQEQRKWQGAENYFQQALQIYSESQDRYAQAGTYHNLGILAKILRQREKASANLLDALERFAEYSDTHFMSITLLHLAKLWNEGRERKLIVQTAAHLEVTEDEGEQWFLKLLEDDDGSGKKVG